MGEQHRTFFLTSITFDREHLFHTPRYGSLLLDVLLFYRDERRYAVHEYVFMPEHIHLILTPTQRNSVERVMQFIKGGYSYRVRKELRSSIEVWQPSFTQHRIEDAEDYRRHVNYIHQNPVRARLVVSPEDYEFSSARKSVRLDAPPDYLRS